MDTYVVRVWAQTADEEEGAGLRGVVEHIASGWSVRFRNAEELVTFLRARGPVEGHVEDETAFPLS
jgi:hypothetical protein